MGLFGRDKAQMPDAGDALPGRSESMPLAPRHLLLDAPLDGPFPETARKAVFGLGCFWGAERMFWSLPGVITTSVGYLGGFTPNPTYKEVCSGRTGHTEVVRIAFRSADVSLEDLLRVFWEGHDPTQGMQQGNDVGTQYRSAVFTEGDVQAEVVAQSRAMYQAELDRAGHGVITTEVASAGPFFYAERDHQQYLGKNPGGYCGLGGTGVACPIGLKPGG